MGLNGAMTTVRLLLALAAASSAVAALAALAAADSPPLKDGVTCGQEPRETYRLSKVARNGMPIKVTCDGPASSFAVPEFVANTPQDRDLTDISGDGYKAPGRTGTYELEAAGTLTVRPRFRPFAVRIMRRYPRTKIKIGLGTLREDGEFWSDPGDWSRTVVVR
jgi:hypothetical protein